MEEEKKLQTEVPTTEDVPSVDEMTTEPVATVTEPVAEATEEGKPYKVFESEEEFNKTLQSASSKAKGEILKELGINSVSAFKEQFSRVSENEQIIEQLTALRKESEALLEEKRKLEDDLLVAKYELTEENKDLFINMVRNSGSELPFAEIAEDIYQRLQGGLFKTTPTKVVIGSDKTDGEIKDSRLSAFERGLGLK